ncbi:alpha/beta hydrolase [Arthrobacter koreensis]|uniref:alpha/beta hydrolase n=1 Tax=Arthrobacter koreensis TaxID=199136 RepID=UPI002DBC86EC|nr:alpha/beta fold hydrolase [Arthrobacter koreensis]MEB7503048.1 alpha/beta fold hydrolase [Arthrobacter koreensis]
MNLALTTGPVPVIAFSLGVAGLCWLCWGPKRYVTRVVPFALIAAAAGTVLLFVAAELLLSWWNASFPRYLYLYSTMGILALLLVVPRWRMSRSIPAKILTSFSAVVVLLASASAANVAYGQYPTVESLLVRPGESSGEVPIRKPLAGQDTTPSTEANWTPPSNMPSQGRVYDVRIPESGSGYAAGSSLVYLPPAYLGTPHAQNLPVLIALHGQPGAPADWFAGGQLQQVMDDFAAQHHGLAPVVVIPDLSGGTNSNWSLCLDSKQGRGATYLAEDVPRWIQANLAAGLNGPQQWATAGYSYGGTCALQLAVNFPDAFPTFIDIAGENEPTIPGGIQTLLDTYFGGDASAFAAQNALDVLKKQSFPNTAGIVVIGKDDGVYNGEGRQVYDAAKAAGMDVQLQELPGGHSWQVWKAGLSGNLDWLGQRLGILGP